MTAQSSAQSPPNVAQSPAHTMCVPLQGDTLCAPCAATLGTVGTSDARQTADSRIVTNAIQSPAKQSLTAIVAPDAAVTAWVHAVRARFPGCRPLWGRSHLGEIGRQP
jgi:hypothetical protein